LSRRHGEDHVLAGQARQVGRIEGAAVLGSPEAGRLAPRGVIVAQGPRAAMAQQALTEARLGPERLTQAYRARSLASGGVRLVFGSGPAVRVPQPFADLAAAMIRQGDDGQPFGGWQAQERVTFEQALAASTSNGAYAAFADGRFGRIAVGQRADFLIVDRDPLLATPEELRATRVLQTWINGQLVFRAEEAPPAPAAAGR
jgi:predicted amidohydrolase YtcJ